MQTVSPVLPPVRPRTRAAHAVARAAERKAIRTFWSRAEKFGEQNLAAAQIILADLERYGGERGLVQWARRILHHEAEKQVAA